VVVIPRALLIALVFVQVALLAGFGLDAATQSITGLALGAPALSLGLIGGSLYVQTFMAIDREVAEEMREAALATCTCGDTAGVLAGEFTGWLMQICLFEHLGIGTTNSSCPWG
jgi:hypothetical protein